MSILAVNNLGKAFRSYRSEWHRFARWFGMPISPAVEHWVVRNIDFSIRPGEAIGIIGKNGAGKSTLLKMITGTLIPTEGHIHVKGRVAAILELGMGFNPELTGRQNAYHAAGLMGFSLDQIQELMPEIEFFAEIGDYFDEPVRTYSSGMQVRVAFSVATACRPEILIIDEALSVGDAAFQRKCFRRIEDYQNAGTSLLFVSHDIESVKKLCNRAIFLKEGLLVSIGEAKKVCDEYQRYLLTTAETKITSVVREESARTAGDSVRFDPSLVASCEMSYGNENAEIESCWLEDLSGNRINVIESGSSFRWCYNVKFNERVENPIFTMMLKTREGIALYGTDSKSSQSPLLHGAAGEVVGVSFTLDNCLAPGDYYLNCGVRVNTPDGVEYLSRRIDSAIIRVISGSGSSSLVGVVDMAAQLSLIQSQGNEFSA